MNDWIALIAGYGFAVLIGHFCVAAVVDGLWVEAGWKHRSDIEVRPAAYLPRLVGDIERVLFVAALQLGKAEFIGVWLALKVAGQWKRWAEGVTVAERKIEGRIFYNVFLIGSGLSIAYSVVGAQIISFITTKQWSFALGLPVALLVGTLLLHKLAIYYQKQVSSSPVPKKTDATL
jgi:hypothetical protein